MIREIKIKNIATGKEVVLNQISAPYILDYVEWDSPVVEAKTYRVPKQIGQSLSGVTIGTRKPIIYGYVTADMSNENVLGMKMSEYYEMQEEKIKKAKKELNSIISVFQDVLITAEGYMLDARPISSVKYSSNEQQNNEVLCYFQIELECYDPLFYKDSKTYDLASVSDAFHFPLVIPSEVGVIFGEVMQRQSVGIENAGDSDVGAVIIIRATGGMVADPKVYNINTNEFFGFSGVSIDEGDYIIITTQTKEENAILHDVSESKNTSIVGNMIDGSTFFKIKQGLNYYAYDVEEQYQGLLEISVTFTEQYFNIEDM